MKVGLILNPKAKTQCVCDVNAKWFYFKNEIRLLQIMYTKLVLNRLKIMWNSTFSYTHWALRLKICEPILDSCNTYHPKTNAQTERTNHALEHLLTMYVGHCQGIWE